MECRKPYMKGVVPLPCGQCIPCRLKRRMIWSHRIILEASHHAHNAFVTLTYSPENLPPNASLQKKHLQDWIKRLRYYVKEPLRYYAVGEYGEETQRPHYHAAVFGIGEHHSTLVQETWSQGHTLTGSLTHDSAQYIAGYVTKKLTTPDNGKNHDYRKKNNCLLGDRTPEFSLMSRNPGIGAWSVDSLAKTLYGEHGHHFKDDYGSPIPSVVQYGLKKKALGRYLKEKLKQSLFFPVRERNYFGKLKAPSDEYKNFMHKMQELSKTWEGDISKKKAFIEEIQQRCLQKEKKFQIYKKGKI